MKTNSLTVLGTIGCTLAWALPIAAKTGHYIPAWLGFILLLLIVPILIRTVLK